MARSRLFMPNPSLCVLPCSGKSRAQCHPRLAAGRRSRPQLRPPPRCGYRIRMGAGGCADSERAPRFSVSHRATHLPTSRCLNEHRRRAGAVSCAGTEGGQRLRRLSSTPTSTRCSCRAEVKSTSRRRCPCLRLAKRRPRSWLQLQTWREPANPTERGLIPSARRFFGCMLFPLFWREVRNPPVLLGFLSQAVQVPPQQGAKPPAVGDLEDDRRNRVLPQHVSDRPLGVEEGTEGTAGKDPVREAEAAGPERLQLRAGTPGHLLGVVGGDRLVPFIDLGCPPVTNPLEQTGEGRVGGGVRAKHEARPVPAWLELAALAGPVFGLGQRLAEPFRARGAELHRQLALHQDHPT